MEQFFHYMFQYYWIDWIVTILVFSGIFLLGDKQKSGFIVGVISTIFALIFSFQIESIANWITAIVLFILYFRGYLKWKNEKNKKI